jgi:hypothetical protein
VKDFIFNSTAKKLVQYRTREYGREHNVECPHTDNDNCLKFIDKGRLAVHLASHPQCQRECRTCDTRAIHRQVQHQSHHKVVGRQEVHPKPMFDESVTSMKGKIDESVEKFRKIQPQDNQLASVSKESKFIFVSEIVEELFEALFPGCKLEDKMLDWIKNNKYLSTLKISDHRLLLSKDANVWLSLSSRHGWSDSTLKDVLNSLFPDDKQILTEVSTKRNSITESLGIKSDSISEEVQVAYLNIELFLKQLLKQLPKQPNLVEVSLKLSIDGAYINHCGDKFLVVDIDLLPSALPTAEAFSPFNSHTILLYKYTKDQQVDENGLRKNLNGIIKSINKIFKYKSIEIEEGSLIQFKHCVVVADLETAHRLMGLYRVYAPTAKYLCLFCRVCCIFFT